MILTEILKAKSEEWRKEYETSRSDADYGRWDAWSNAATLAAAATVADDDERIRRARGVLDELDKMRARRRGMHFLEVVAMRNRLREALDGPR